MVEKSLEKLVGRFTDLDPKAEGETTESDRGVNIRLFECSKCAITYVCESMEACSQCGGPVTHIQNERDLGLTGTNYH